MSFADTLSDRERARARRFAYLSTCSGCISEVMMDQSAILILYFTMLKASAMITMFSSSVSGVMAMLLYIPCASIADKIGLKNAVKYACMIACVGLLLMASAAFFSGTLALTLALLGAFVYCAQRSLYGCTWYPLLDYFLKQDERAKFFSVMRTSYMVFNGIIFFIIGVLLGKEPPMWLMQSVIAFAGVAILFRWYCIAQFPMPAEVEGKKPYELVKSLKITLRNAPLTGYATYTLIVSMAYTVLVPLAFLYFRNQIQMPAGTIQILSSVGMAGAVIGHFLYRYISRKLKLKWIELVVHVTFLILSFCFFVLDPGMFSLTVKGIPFFTLLMGFLLFILYVCNAWMMSNTSMEYLALARPGNKTMAIAFCHVYISIGTTIGRVGSSLLLGVGFLAPSWNIGSRTFCVYQSIFLMTFVILAVAMVLIPILPSFVPPEEKEELPEAK